MKNRERILAKKMRITQAYCQQLERVVSIDEARLEYLSQEPPQQKYQFFCSSPDCLAQHVRVIGVNYQRSAEESAKYKTPHFREHDKHLPTCDWVISTEQEYFDGRLENETEQQAKLREIRRKLSDLIDRFDPRLKGDKSDTDHSLEHTSDATNLVPATTTSIKEPNAQSATTGRHSTSLLSRLVETWREAKRNLSYEELQQLELEVAGAGTVSLRDYFRRVLSVWDTGFSGVMYGGARPDFKRYGLGFRLTFFDKINECELTLYISKEKMEKYRYRRHLDTELKRSDIRYINVYFIPDGISTYINKSGQTVYNIDIGDLRHLVLVIEPK